MSNVDKIINKLEEGSITNALVVASLLLGSIVTSKAIDQKSMKLQTNTLIKIQQELDQNNHKEIASKLQKEIDGMKKTNSSLKTRIEWTGHLNRSERILRDYGITPTYK